MAFTFLRPNNGKKQQGATTGRIKNTGGEHNAIGRHRPALTSVATCSDHRQGGGMGGRHATGLLSRLTHAATPYTRHEGGGGGRGSWYTEGVCCHLQREGRQSCGTTCSEGPGIITIFTSVFFSIPPSLCSTTFITNHEDKV